MDQYIQKLRDMKQTSLNSVKEVDAQHQKNRLMARERLDLLLDPGSFNEIDALVLPRYEAYPGGKKSRAGDGIVTGFGQIHARHVMVASQDISVVGGTFGEMHANKIVKCLEQAMAELDDLAGKPGYAGLVAEIQGHIDEAQQKLAQHGLAGKDFIHIHPASRWLFKCWPSGHMTALIRSLQAQGQRIVITAAPDAAEQMRMAVRSRFMMPPGFLEQASLCDMVCQRQHTNEGQTAFRE